MKAELIKDDPRVGCKVRCLDNGFRGVVESIMRFDDGLEYYNIEDGSGGGRGGVDVSNVVFERDLEGNILEPS